MRTTVTMDPALLEQVKRRATVQGTTVSRVIEDSVRVAMSTYPEEHDEGQGFELVTFGEGGRFSDLDLDKTAALLERDDLERYGTRGR